MKYAQRALRCKFMSALLYLGVLGTVVPSVTVIPTSFPLSSFRHGGPGALAAELSLDVRRMWLRNCGRDDRLVADRGREVIDVSVICIRLMAMEVKITTPVRRRMPPTHSRLVQARHPFLDEGLMDLLLGLPLHCIADLRQAPGLGDKRILRQALVRLGEPRVEAGVCNSGTSTCTCIQKHLSDSALDYATMPW